MTHQTWVFQAGIWVRAGDAPGPAPKSSTIIINHNHHSFSPHRDIKIIQNHHSQHHNHHHHYYQRNHSKAIILLLTHLPHCNIIFDDFPVPQQNEQIITFCSELCEGTHGRDNLKKKLIKNLLILLHCFPSDFVRVIEQEFSVHLRLFMDFNCREHLLRNSFTTDCTSKLPPPKNSNSGFCWKYKSTFK